MTDNKVPITLPQLEQLCSIALRNGTEAAAIDCLLQWARGANAEIARLRADRAALLAALDQMRERERALREALAELLDACDAHNKANGKQMIDKHAEANARAALAAAPKAGGSG